MIELDNHKKKIIFEGFKNYSPVCFFVPQRNRRELTIEEGFLDAALTSFRNFPQSIVDRFPVSTHRFEIHFWALSLLAITAMESFGPQG